VHREFNLCSPYALEEASARALFAGDGVVFLPVQENDPACGEEVCNLRKVCEVMTDLSLGCPVSECECF
ncbi:unnamed protein product, partial [Discosporangium mesarthrocarpum]